MSKPHLETGRRTPAPWTIVHEDNLIVGSDARRTIACHLAGNSKSPDVLADARLIAAAPELLEVLREAAVYVPDHHGPINHKINAVIAKATGAA